MTALGLGFPERVGLVRYSNHPHIKIGDGSGYQYPIRVKRVKSLPGQRIGYTRAEAQPIVGSGLWLLYASGSDQSLSVWQEPEPRYQGLSMFRARPLT